MNKRQKKKRDKREIKYIIRSVNQIEELYTNVAVAMREHYGTLPEGTAKYEHDLFIAGFEHALKYFGMIKYSLKNEI
ncbi:TPA: hypothetical protein ACGO11_000535 [Streptococcus suis]